MKYKCLVLDHDDTVVQTERCIGYPYFKEYLAKIRPGTELTFRQYVEDCNNMVFADVCRLRWNMTEEEQAQEYQGWKIYYRDHPRPIFPGIDRLIARQKAEGGLVCVASLSRRDDILSDYATHFGIVPDAVYDYEMPADQRKPHPWPLLDLMKRFDLKPEEILVLDDMKLGWMMANAAGVDIAYAAWSKAEFPHLMEEMKGLCRYTFEEVDQLLQFLFEE
jgi:phosphoglycolate phosphatase/pyrophosphatase PpaX